MNQLASTTLTREMTDEALSLVPDVVVRRTIASPYDSLIGHLGEMASAEMYLRGRLKKFRTSV